MLGGSSAEVFNFKNKLNLFVLIAASLGLYAPSAEAACEPAYKTAHTVCYGMLKQGISPEDILTVSSPSSGTPYLETASRAHVVQAGAFGISRLRGKSVHQACDRAEEIAENVTAFMIARVIACEAAIQTCAATCGSTNPSLQTACQSTMKIDVEKQVLQIAATLQTLAVARTCKDLSKSGGKT